MNKQITILSNAINKIKASEGIEDKEAFNKLLQWCGLRLGIFGVVFKSNTETYTYLNEKFELELLKESYKDNFGELYYKLGLNNKNKALINYQSALDIVNDIYKNDKNSSELIHIYLDVSCGTGRTLMAMNKKTSGKSLLYGIEKDDTMYKISLVNLALHGIYAKIVSYNGNVDIKDFSPENIIWDKANNWNTKTTKFV